MNKKEILFLDLQKITAKYHKEINENVQRVISSGWYLQGEENQKFESEYAYYIGSKYCVGVANGFDALYLILRSYIELGVMKQGDEVVVPTNTYIATIMAISDNGLIPKLVEPNIHTYVIDDNEIEKAITEKTKAVMITHLYGQCGYTDKIGEICRKYSLILIEDNAQSHGCLFLNDKTGSLGDASAHSFYPSKNLGALGDAGAVTTNDEKLSYMVRTLANYGSAKKYIFDYNGRNSRLDEIQATVLRVKLKYLDFDTDLRRQVAKYYIDNIKNSRIILPYIKDWNAHVFHIFPIRCKERDRLQIYLLENGIQTVIHYPIPPHQQKCYKEWGKQHFPITEEIHNTELSLPISHVMEKRDVKRIVEVINSF